jgi:hypothetical protein
VASIVLVMVVDASAASRRQSADRSDPKGAAGLRGSDEVANPLLKAAHVRLAYDRRGQRLLRGNQQAARPEDQPPGCIDQPFQGSCSVGGQVDLIKRRITKAQNAADRRLDQDLAGREVTVNCY